MSHSQLYAIVLVLLSGVPGTSTAADTMNLQQEVQNAIDSGNQAAATKLLKDYIDANRGTSEGNEACVQLEQIEGRPGPSSGPSKGWTQGYITLTNCERRVGWYKVKTKRGKYDKTAGKRIPVVTLEFRTDKKAKKTKYAGESLVTYAPYKTAADFDPAHGHPGFIVSNGKRIEGRVYMAGRVYESHWNPEYPGTKIVSEYDAPRFRSVWVEPETGGQVFWYSVDASQDEWRVSSATIMGEDQTRTYVDDGGQTCSAEKYCYRHLILHRSPEEEEEATRKLLADEKYRALWDSDYATRVLREYNDRQKRINNAKPVAAAQADDGWVLLANGVGSKRRCIAYNGSELGVSSCTRRNATLFKAEDVLIGIRLRGKQPNSCLTASEHPGASVTLSNCNNAVTGVWGLQNAGSSGGSSVYRIHSKRMQGGCMTLDERSGRLTVGDSCKRDGTTLITVIRANDR